MKTKNITTTLSLDAIQFLTEASEEMNVKKNKIIEDALLFWKKKFIQQKIKNSYKNAKSDKNWNTITEEDFIESNFLFEKCPK